MTALDRIYQSLIDLVPASFGLPAIDLTPGERMVHAGSSFRTAPLVVRAVCRAVKNHPALFDDLPVDPGAILAGQDRATAYFCLFAALQRLTRRAYDCYLYEQSRAAGQAMGVVRYGRHQIKGPYRSLRQRLLEDALRPAETLLAKEQARKTRARRRAKITP